jgi:hypothetical protein
MKYRLAIVVIALLCAVSLVLFFRAAVVGSHSAFSLTERMTPWQCVGGCGAGGSGGGSTGIKWVGEGVSGAVQLEVLPKLDFSRTFCYLTTAPRLTYTVRGNTEIGLSIPLGFMASEVQYQTNIAAPEVALNGGRGDLTCDVTKFFGAENQYSWLFGLTFPTGEYDAARGTDKSQFILPQSMQMGKGVYSATLDLSYTRDLDKGMLLFDGYCYYPFNVSISGKNAYINSNYRAYQNTTDNRRRFYYRFKPYGENDRGGYFPPEVSGDAMYAYRGIPKMTHSFQFFFSAPLGVRWIPNYNQSSNLYDPRPDPDNRAWDIVLAYGVEFSKDMFPIFLGFGLPIHSARGVAGDNVYDPTPFAKWHAPDWSDLGQEWIFALGFKVAMF